MKQTLLVVVASAAIGAAAALYFSNPPPPARATPQLDVRALQFAMERALESVGFGSQARAPQAAPPAEAAREDPAPAAEIGERAASRAREESDPVLPPASRQTIESLRAFDKDDVLRRTWLFRSERDVIAWLGTPDEVTYEAGGERWIYNKQVGGAVVAFFARGRLLNIME